MIDPRGSKELVIEARWGAWSSTSSVSSSGEGLHRRAFFPQLKATLLFSKGIRRRRYGNVSGKSSFKGLTERDAVSRVSASPLVASQKPVNAE